ncbi:restriction endonuclease subunit S [Octadecabacter antarcticus]|uniref:restriction endonuclease subunit S n=1 Tax=Octadecabacter antarcticus TaxID=1217908 RepID=UPI000307A40D|nr:restriction endonuclease subunit S [Octadecabacter antarcticus]
MGVIPDDWEVSTLANLAEYPMQNGVFFEANRKGKGCPMINVGDLYGGSPIPVGFLERFDASPDEQKRFQVNDGDLFFTRSSIVPSGIAQCNHVSIAEGDTVVFDSHVIRYRPNPKIIDALFLFRACTASNTRRYLISHAKTGTMTTIDQRVLSACPITFPPLPEQRAIAEALSDADALIAALEAMIAKKRDLKQAAMQQLLTGKTRLPGFSGEWKVSQQQDVITFINGRAYGRHEWETSGTPVCRLQNLTGSGEKFYYSKLVLPERQYMLEGDLIYMWSASFGPHIWTGPRAIFHYHIWKLECDTEEVDRQFYYYKLVEITEALQATMGGSTMLHLTKTGMEKFLVNLPPIEEQTAIAEVLSDMDADLAALEARAAKARTVKQGMMQELLTGKVRLV